MRLNLIFGFLGSGKTTLVRQVLDQRARAGSTAVIVNEFGDVGIDGAILEGQNIDMIQLTSGCLCCTLKGSLIEAIEELRDRGGVERTVVEASGVAEPSDMLDSFDDPRYGSDFDLGPVVTVVDIPKFAKIRDMLGDFYTEQVAHADVVLLNKIDLAPSAEIDAVHDVVTAINPRATVIYTEQCDTDLALLLEGTGGRSRTRHHHGHDHDHGDGDGHDHAHAQFDSLVLEGSADVTRDAVERFFGGLDPGVFRAKGFMSIDGETRLVQFSSGQLDIHPAEQGRRPQMVFIGKGLDRRGLEENFAFAYPGGSAAAAGGARG